MSCYAGNKVRKNNFICKTFHSWKLHLPSLSCLNSSLFYREANRMDLNYPGKLERSDPLSLLNSLTLQKKIQITRRWKELEVRTSLRLLGVEMWVGWVVCWGCLVALTTMLSYTDNTVEFHYACTKSQLGPTIAMLLILLLNISGRRKCYSCSPLFSKQKSFPLSLSDINQLPVIVYLLTYMGNILQATQIYWTCEYHDKYLTVSRMNVL